LQAAEDEEAEHLAGERSLEVAARQEIQVGQQEHYADEAAGKAVRPFPPEDELEAVQRHVVIDLLELRRLLVLGEKFQPVGLGKRRQGADQRLPFDDRQSRMRQPRHAADHHGEENHGTAGEQPPGHGALLVTCRHVSSVLTCRRPFPAA
jgi:hypothetical protein